MAVAAAAIMPTSKPIGFNLVAIEKARIAIVAFFKFPDNTASIILYANTAPLAMTNPAACALVASVCSMVCLAAVLVHKAANFNAAE